MNGCWDAELDCWAGATGEHCSEAGLAGNEVVGLVVEEIVLVEEEVGLVTIEVFRVVSCCFEALVV